MASKPETIEQYRKWLKDERNIEVTSMHEMHYNLAANKMKQDLESSTFWVKLTANLSRYDQKYQLKTGYPLFSSSPTLTLKIKPWKSFFEKTYRRNILENDHFPKEPEDGWITPKNWLSRINDIIRTLMIVKYFDGVSFVADEIESLCGECALDLETTLEAKEEGYYAAHLYTKHLSEIPRITLDTEKIESWIEIQISTQLQEVIRRLLHKYYEQKRTMVKKPAGKWQWDHECDEFATNYLGHILHYVEGMILDVRERQRREIV